jgi:hypothetical protein
VYCRSLDTTGHGGVTPSSFQGALLVAFTELEVHIEEHSLPALFKAV